MPTFIIFAPAQSRPDSPFNVTSFWSFDATSESRNVPQSYKIHRFDVQSPSFVVNNQSFLSTNLVVDELVAPLEEEGLDPLLDSERRRLRRRDREAEPEHAERAADARADGVPAIIRESYQSPACIYKAEGISTLICTYPSCSFVRSTSNAGSAMRRLIRSSVVVSFSAGLPSGSVSGIS